MEKHTYHHKHNKKRDKLTQISKYLALVLRHKAVDFGLEIEPNGFINVDSILNLHKSKQLNISLQIIKDIVSNDEKGRYELINRPPYFIRAVQGHSMQQVTNEATLTPIKNIFNYPTVVHGTNYQAWGFIKETGLNKMTRNAIHFSIGYSNDSHVKSGMRKTCEIFIEINAVFAFFNEIPFYTSLNNVVLCPGVNGVLDVKYIKKVSDVNGNVLYEQKYDVVVYVEKEKISVYKEGVKVIGFCGDNVDCLNNVGNYLVSKRMFKECGVVTVINDAWENEFVGLVKELCEKNLLKYAALFVDYIVKKKEESVENLCGKVKGGDVRKVKVDWELFYENIGKENEEE